MAGPLIWQVACRRWPTLRPAGRFPSPNYLGCGQCERQRVLSYIKGRWFVYFYITTLGCRIGFIVA
ncbi:protein of unknown function (plasmid) [Cupriavidus taiwanensis]|uniref:Uncharacterized protein n=1 Tax=Cupriavidus taiwanensis TaxID=164546 RepID=A0A375FM15_9BURK|nr:protein of unknown function [Cupriavidus taiwanensis]SPA57382.1 protein of unknown function [Cupriavidus taiwanensis]SPD49204.1 protein of unknown function [Cupriavidus taiwanensis]